LEFVISLAQPVSSAVDWQVKIPASYGQVSILPQGTKAIVRYLSLETLTGVDFFCHPRD
jgi:hypothetical protein